MRLVLTVLFCAAALLGQTNPAAVAARRWRTRHEKAIVTEFTGLLSIPNIARDRPNIRRNADAIVAMLAKRGVPARLVEEPDANPVVYGEIRTPGATRTIVFYAHYDGQPLDPKEWLTPPFEPVLRDKSIEKDGPVISLAAAPLPLDPEYRIYARSSSDDKAPILALAVALDAIHAAPSNIAPTSASFSKVKKKPDPSTSGGSSTLTGISSPATSGLSAMVPYRRTVSNSLPSARGESKPSISPSMAPDGNCTAATTATGRRTPP